MSCRTLVRQPLCLWIEEWRYVFARITQLMDDAILNFRLGKYSPNRRRESRQVIRAGNENVLHACLLYTSFINKEKEQLTKSSLSLALFD